MLVSLSLYHLFPPYFVKMKERDLLRASLHAQKTLTLRSDDSDKAMREAKIKGEVLPRNILRVPRIARNILLFVGYSARHSVS